MRDGVALYIDVVVNSADPRSIAEHKYAKNMKKGRKKE